MTETTSSGKKQLILIVAIALSATIIPYIMYLTGVGIPGETTNKGILVGEPVPVGQFTLTDRSGQPWDLAEKEPKFRLVFLVDGSCDTVCRDHLHATRQVRVRLGRDAEQLQRLYINLGDRPLEEAFVAFVKEEHPQLVLLRGDRQEWLSMLSERPELSTDLNGHEYYLLHRYGALALAYNQSHKGTELLEDLEFLISTSN